MPESTSSSPNRLKRQQSETSDQEQETKRQRISPGKTPPPAVEQDLLREEPAGQESKSGGTTDNANARDPRRKTGIADEKQRSKRLFGALLGNLNQPGDRTSKRRQEIESRRKAELQRQDEEHVEKTSRQREKFEQQWRKAQLQVNFKNMQIRHSNMLHRAKFLHTRSEPIIYYRPWDLKSDEEDQIDQQVEEAQAQIDRELNESKEQHDMIRQEDSENSAIAPSPANGPDNDSQLNDRDPTRTENGLIDESDKQDKVQDQASAEAAATSEDLIAAEIPGHDTTDKSNNCLPTEEIKTITNINIKDASLQDAEEEADHFVEGDEDTVIY